MNVKFNFQINNSSFGNSKSSKDKKDMTPQEEYWLNRFLRDHAGKLVLLFILFFVFLFGIIYFVPTDKSVSTSKNIDVQISR